MLEVTNWFVKKFSGRSIEEHIEDEGIKETEKVFVKYGFKPLN